MTGRTYEDGRRNGIKACIAWLHERANQMNDPHAQAVLNSAAFSLGVEKPDPSSAPARSVEAPEDGSALEGEIRGVLFKLVKPECGDEWFAIDAATAAIMDALSPLAAALTLAEDVLSRSPYSNAFWPNGMHPNAGITLIRDALATLPTPPKAEGDQ